MRWAIKVHCVYANRFWAAEGLSGATMSDDGIVRITADNSPPSGAPGILVGFIEETEALRISSASSDERRAAVVADLVKYFGAHAADPLTYREKHWGDDPFSRGIDGGYWSPGIWTAYGAALRRSTPRGQRWLISGYCRRWRRTNLQRDNAATSSQKSGRVCSFGRAD